jgi:glycosyltransferase involved in cell wall biosynthesis
VDLLSFATATESEDWDTAAMEIFATREVVPITMTARLLGLALAPGIPIAVAARNMRSFRTAISSAGRANRPDVVLFDNMAMWQYAGDVRSGVLRVGIAQDVFSQLWARKADNWSGLCAFAARAEARRLRKWETSTLRKLDLVCALSEKDSHLLSAVAEEVRQWVLQPWFSRPSDTTFSSAAKEDNSIVFAGAFDRRENVDAVAFAVSEVLSRVAAEIPHYAFHLAGAACEKLAGGISRHPQVRVHGFVADLQTCLARMQIALLPLRLGAGIKIKLLEAMAAGLAVVTTPVGAEGINAQQGVHFLVGTTAEELARHTIVLLQNPRLCAQFGQRARVFIQSNYDFEKSVRDFEWTLLELVSERRFRTSRRGSPASRGEAVLCNLTQGQVRGG